MLGKSNTFRSSVQVAEITYLALVHNHDVNNAGSKSVRAQDMKNLVHCIFIYNLMKVKAHHINILAVLELFCAWEVEYI